MIAAPENFRESQANGSKAGEKGQSARQGKTNQS